LVVKYFGSASLQAFAKWWSSKKGKWRGIGLKREEKRSMSNIYRRRGQQPMRGAASP
jgi:hypothetical protein